MNTYFRLSIAILVSLLAHVVLLMWVMQQVRVRSLDEHGLLQVYLPQHTNEHASQPLLQSVEPSSATTKKAKAKREQKQMDTVKSAQDNSTGRLASGHFLWQPPPVYQQNEIMNAMQFAQLAHQRESQAAAVMAGLSNLSAQLRPAITASIVCTQQANNEIDCTPEPEEKIRPLLEQFFSLSMEARRFGIAGNPVHMDFGPGLGVSVILLH